MIQLHNPENRFSVRTFDVEYRRTADGPLLARIYQPEGDGPFPALLYVHGGAWSSGQRTSDAAQLQILAETGLVVAAIDFRLAPQHPYPAQVQDVNYAARWLKAHAAEFNAVPQPIGGIGASSGGHTLMLSAMRPKDQRYASFLLEDAPDVHSAIDYVIALWPIMDSYARYLYACESGNERLAKSTEGYFLTKEAMLEGNPQRILDRAEAVELPPTLVIQGTADANIPIALTQCFTAAYRTAGGQIELHQFPEMPHGFGGWPAEEVDRALVLMKGFIVRQTAALAAV